MEIRYSRKTYFIQIVFIIVLHFSLTFSYTQGYFKYGKNTEITLCDAQCEALCMDHVPNCEGLCAKSNRTWIASCDGPYCPGTCSLLQNRYHDQINNLVPTPTPRITHFDDTSFELSWDAPPVTPLTTIFVIQQKTAGLRNTSTVKMIDWTRVTKYKIDRVDVCTNNSYRVVAVNQFGSMGFSNYIKVPGLQGHIENLKYSGQGVYFSKNMSLFMAILEWSLPAGWRDEDIGHYDINPAVKTYCKDMNHLSLPTFRQMQNRTKGARRVLMTISTVSVGCVFTPQIRLVSRCGVYGPWTNITVDLDCSLITGYNCKPKPFDPPGNAENVTLAVSPANPPSPFAVDLHIRWQPPSDLGSMGKIDKYVIRTGKAEQLIPPLPASFTEKPMVRNVSEDIRELIFQLRTEPSPFTYGVQVIPYAPNQYMSAMDMGILPVKMVHVGHNDSMALFRKQGDGKVTDPSMYRQKEGVCFQRKGTVLYDNNGTVIVYMNKTMPVHFMFDVRLGKNLNSSINRYAVEWGPLLGPNQLFVENRTVVPMNQTELSVFLKRSVRDYGLKMRYLSPDDEEPEGTDWEDIEVVSFQLPDYEEEVHKELKPHASDSINLVPVYILVPVITLLILIIIFLRLGIRRQHFKNLEHRLIQIEGQEVYGEIEHYYTMRTQESVQEDLPPTVVPDAWELPHTCLRIGRTLGSGAFGQVVRGRISRSLLMHRGINLHGADGKSGLFVTVAVKMLQEYTEDLYREDFLKEIQMMKDIGYHRNLVSILGCCTLREPYCLIVEHVPYGDLLTCLRKIRHKIQEQEDEIGNYINQEVELFSPLDLLSVARQIALGMEYLSQKGYVHRDLAARNILVGKNKTVKVGDFGLARYIYHDVGKVYVNRRGGKLPLKWMSVEAIFDMIFSTASDVWAFGVLLFEIVTLGGYPYPLLSNTDLLTELKNGYRMEKPENCSDEIYEIMLWCWKARPSDRPTFTQLLETFTAMLQRDSGQDYFTLDVNEGHEYYKIKPEEMDRDEGDIETAIKRINEKTVKVDDVKIDNSGTDKVKVDDSGYLLPKMPAEKIENEKVGIPKADTKMDKIENEEMQHEKVGITKPVRYIPKENVEKVKPINDNPNESIDKTKAETDTPDHDTVSNTSSNASSFKIGRRSPPELDRLSGSSDDVFTDCPGCVKLGENKRQIQACPECRKTRIELSLFDLHSPDRNDSAISSATSDELQSDDGQSPNIVVSSTPGKMDTKNLNEKDEKAKAIVRQVPSTSYYDEASISEMIKKYPVWTEHGKKTNESFRFKDKFTEHENVFKANGNMLGSMHKGSIEPTPYCYSRYHLSSDPYFDVHSNIGKMEAWSIAETQM